MICFVALLEFILYCLDNINLLTVKSFCKKLQNLQNSEISYTRKIWHEKKGSEEVFSRGDTFAVPVLVSLKIKFKTCIEILEPASIPPPPTHTTTKWIPYHWGGGTSHPPILMALGETLECMWCIVKFGTKFLKTVIYHLAKVLFLLVRMHSNCYSKKAFVWHSNSDLTLNHLRHMKY